MVARQALLRRFSWQFSGEIIDQFGLANTDALLAPV